MQVKRKLYMCNRCSLLGVVFITKSVSHRHAARAQLAPFGDVVGKLNDHTPWLVRYEKFM